MARSTSGKGNNHVLFGLDQKTVCPDEFPPARSGFFFLNLRCSATVPIISTESICERIQGWSSFKGTSSKSILCEASSPRGRYFLKMAVSFVPYLATTKSPGSGSTIGSTMIQSPSSNSGADRGSRRFHGERPCGKGQLGKKPCTRFLQQGRIAGSPAESGRLFGSDQGNLDVVPDHNRRCLNKRHLSHAGLQPGSRTADHFLRFEHSLF